MRQPAKILVIDDERSVRMMLEAALRSQGFRVSCASICAVARYMLHAEVLDLLLLDWHIGYVDVY